MPLALCASSHSPLIVLSAAELDEHETPPWHPEHRGRLDAALAGIDEAGLGEATQWRVPEPVSTDDLALVHDPVYVEAVEAFCHAGGGQLDPDTSVSEGSWPTARRSAGAVLQAITALRDGECDAAFAAGRPPGAPPVTLVVSADGRELGRIQPQSGWGDYSLPLSHPAGPLVLTLRSDTFRPRDFDRNSPDDRARGVMISRLAAVAQ